MSEVRILSPCGMLGYGFPEVSFLRGLERKPHVIAVRIPVREENPDQEDPPGGV